MTGKAKSKDSLKRWFKDNFKDLKDEDIEKIPQKFLEAVHKRIRELEDFQCEHLGPDNTCNHPQSRCPVRPNTSICCRYCYEGCYHVCEVASFFQVCEIICDPSLSCCMVP